MESTRSGKHQGQALIIGGGIAGIVTALELLEGGQSVVLVDRDSPERFGGLARWAFGGMAIVGTPEQKRMKVADSPELAFEDWVRFGELSSGEKWPRAWAQCYVEESRAVVYDWLKSLGLKFMPAVNWVERGSSIKGNSVPRYHILWGAGRELTETLIARLVEHPNRERLTVLHRHRVTALELSGGAVRGCRGVNETSGADFSVRGGPHRGGDRRRQRFRRAGTAALADSLAAARRRSCSTARIPISNGEIHADFAQRGGRLTHLDDMWNYAAGIPHPQPHFEGHGLSLVPCKSGLWLSPDGEPVGPAPMVTGFDTREMCRQVAAHPYTWQVLNWKIAAKELAISGSQHNPRIVNHQLFRFLLDLLLGNDRLVRQMVDESTEFIVADGVDELAGKMNQLTGEKPHRRGSAGRAGPGIRSGVGRSCRRATSRHPAHRRTSPMARRPATDLQSAAVLDRKAGPLLAIRLHFISRKSLGGIQTDLQGRALAVDGKPMAGLYAVGEAAGFGGGGASGKRSLEGTFLSGCILTARKAAAAMLGAP